MPQRPTREHGVNPTLVMPFGKKLHSLHTGFLSQFTHVSDSSAYVEDLPLSLSAVLLAEACNIGLTPVIHPEIPALTRDR